jgi:hypothetical protein
MFLKRALNKTDQQPTAGQSSRRRKYLLYGFGAGVLVLTVLYFVRQFNALTGDRPLGLAPPARQERLDTTKGKPAALTRLYEQEEKNRYQDSISLAREEKALDYIVMDWENLYDVKKKQTQAEPEKVHSADSLVRLLRLLKAEDSVRTSSSLTKSVAKAAAVKQKAARIKPAGKRQQQREYTSAPVDPFNTVRATGYGSSPLATYASPNTASNRRALGPVATTTSSLVSELIPAVVHGEHKVNPGGKVVFRTQAEGRVQGTLLPRNTLVTGIAHFNNGRITFSSFRAKVAGSSLVLPFGCYDWDLMAGISFSDGSVTEAEVRRGAVSSLTSAAGELSNAIPYGALARATSDIARGAIRGSARSKQQFIYLSDGYKVFLQPQPDQK